MISFILLGIGTLSLIAGIGLIVLALIPGSTSTSNCCGLELDGWLMGAPFIVIGVLFLAWGVHEHNKHKHQQQTLQNAANVAYQNGYAQRPN